MRKFLLFLLPLLLPATANASVEWTLRNQLNLEAPPLQTVAAADGKTVYFLIPGKILVFSLAENRMTDFMPVDRKFDDLAVQGKDRLFVLSSSKDKTISIFERKKVLDLSGLHYRGPADAPVVVAVFSDYQ